MKFNANDVAWVRPEYVAQAKIWEKVRDACEGEEAIKYKRELYLPRLGGHSKDVDGNKLYQLYLSYAHWYGATQRTVAGLRGLVFRKDPIKNIPESMEPYVDNITADGQNMISFTKDVLVEVIQTNRCGVFVDFPMSFEKHGELTKAEAEKLNIRPYTRMYKAEDIINWRTDEVNNETITTLVVLKEEIEEVDVGGFATKKVKQYRVLYIDTEDLYYKQQIFRNVAPDPDKKIEGGMQSLGVITPIVKNEPLTAIPFFPITDKGVTWDINNPTILPLVNTNISYYKNSANREQALIWTGNPTPVFSGFSGQADDGSVSLGSTQAILLHNGGTAQFLEFTGQGINPIKDVMEEKKEEMAVLGARIISPEKRTAETAESALIHRAGEQGVLADIANSVSDGLTRVLRFFGEYLELVTDEIWIKLNTDFMPSPIDYRLLEALGQLQKDGMISWETYVYNLQQGEILPTGVTADEEQAKISQDSTGKKTPVEQNNTQKIAEKVK